MQSIEIKGKSYPCRLTMGALRRFKATEGKDVSSIGNDVSALGTLLWCATVSACKADGVVFEMGLDDFADSVSLNDIKMFAKAMSVSDSSEKKTMAEQ